MIETLERYNIIRNNIYEIYSYSTDTNRSNRMEKNSKFLQELENDIQKVKTDAAYFFEAGGDRTFAFIINIETADMIPSIAEP